MSNKTDNDVIILDKSLIIEDWKNKPRSAFYNHHLRNTHSFPGNAITSYYRLTIYINEHINLVIFIRQAFLSCLKD